MPAGSGGKYEPEATAVMDSAEAESVVLIVLGGSKGSGFSIVSRTKSLSPPVLIAVLRKVADDMAEGTMN